MPDRKSFLLRIDADLYEALRAWSEQEMRSVNGQIEYVLRQAIAARKGHRGGERPLSQLAPGDVVHGDGPRQRAAGTDAGPEPRE